MKTQWGERYFSVVPNVKYVCGDYAVRFHQLHDDILGKVDVYYITIYEMWTDRQGNKYYFEGSKIGQSPYCSKNMCNKVFWNLNQFHFNKTTAKELLTNIKYFAEDKDYLEAYYSSIEKAKNEYTKYRPFPSN